MTNWSFAATRMRSSVFFLPIEIDGFPTKFPPRYKKACKHTSPNSQHSFSAFTTLPYIQGVSDEIQ